MLSLAALLLAQSVPATVPPKPAATARARVQVVAAVRVRAGRAEAASRMQVRDRPGLRLVEFQ